MPNCFLYWIAALFGLIFGSFANVLILRDNRRRSILTGRSECPHCKHELAWYELIPVVSFVIQGGKCRACRKPISWQYPLVELAAAGLAVLAFQIGYIDHANALGAVLLFASLLLFLVMSGIDIRTQTVWPEYTVIAGLLGGLSYLYPNYQVLGAVVGAGSLLLVSAIWKVLFKQDGMGEGDAWIAGAIGLIVGYPLILVALFGAIFSGALSGVLAIAGKKGSLEARIPFGPFLFLGLLIALLWGNQLIAWYTGISGITF